MPIMTQKYSYVVGWVTVKLGGGGGGGGGHSPSTAL